MTGSDPWTHKIRIVDDPGFSLELMADILPRAGFRISCSGCSFPDDFSEEMLIAGLCDGNSARLSQIFDFCRRFPDLPVIVVSTARLKEQPFQLLTSLTNIALIYTPFTLGQLLGKIQVAFSRRGTGGSDFVMILALYSQSLFRSSDPLLEKELAEIAVDLKIDRAALIERQSDSREDWRGRMFQALFSEGGVLEEWVVQLELGAPVIGLSGDFPGKERDFLGGIGISFLAVFPVFIKNTFQAVLVCGYENPGVIDPAEIKRLAVMADITSEHLSKKAIERDVRRIQHRLNLAVEGGSDGLWDWPDVTREEQWWSPRFYSNLGYDPDDIPATIRNFSELIHPEDRDEVIASEMQQIRSGEPAPRSF